MKRRQWLSHLGRMAIFAAVPLLAPDARADERVRRIGFLSARSRGTPSNPDQNYEAFLRGMRELGYVDGRNIVIEARFADGNNDRLPALANELARANVDVLVAYGTAAVQALQRATTTIPIVITAAVDPIGSGFGASLAHPGGNITGQSALAVDLSQKQLELLQEMVPGLSRVAVLVNPGNTRNPAVLKSVDAAAQRHGIKVQAIEASGAADIERGFDQAKREHVEAILVAADATLSGQGRQIAAAASRVRMPTISYYQEHVAAGGLMSYGQNIAEFHRSASTYVDRILKGANPGDLPIEQPTRIELVINLKTAKALGLAPPQSLLLRADEVIQ